MGTWNGFTHWSAGRAPDAAPEEVRAEAEAFLRQAAQRGEATLITLDAGFLLGWHPELETFQVVARRADAPADLPPFLAMLLAARHVHAGADSEGEAIACLLENVRAAVAQLEAQPPA
ncbi:MAG: hypothetical protein VKP62_09970 [Candidatus Sericytochromatia bacterium]|nr:hypothetical protein [Candidatus Sericytochromatia bacterium]